MRMWAIIESEVNVGFIARDSPADMFAVKL